MMLEQYSYRTKFGKMINDDSLNILNMLKDESINLCITSPPFALQRKKEYGNEDQSSYIDWLMQFAKLIKQKLKIDGSFVIDLGGAYQKGIPIRSLYNYRILIKLCDELGFNLAEEFFWNNPSKLPSPIEWVNKRKIRVKDAVNTVWWLSKSNNPKADITKVLVPYSERMKKLIKSPESYYKAKVRPSGHNIGNGFGKNNGGAIASNLLVIPNSESNSLYLQRCKIANAKSHPARFPEKLPHFFINMLTDENDIVLDIFAGSNTTGIVAEQLKRRWIGVENRLDYVKASSFRFLDRAITKENLIKVYNNISKESNFNLETYQSIEKLNI